MPRRPATPVTLPWTLEAVAQHVNGADPDLPLHLNDLAVTDAMVLACVCLAQRTGSAISIDQAARALGVTREQYGDLRGAVIRLGGEMTRKLLAGRTPSAAVLE